MEQIGKIIETAATLLEQRGDAPQAPKPTYTPPAGTIHCACGKKFIPMTDVRYFDTRHIKGVADTVCKECWPDVKGLVPIVCVKCKAVVSRVQPHRTPSGFAFLKGESYHTDVCPNCRPNVKVSVLLEKYFYDKERGIPQKVKL
jgi:hypothetical protein